jgi:hypothetical protein
MDRIVYCPSEAQIDDAIKIAEEWALPIQIGDSQKTESLDFDRGKASVVMVPINNGFMMHIPEKVNFGYSMAFDYLNDFADVSNYKLKVSKNGQECTFSLLVRDKHSLIGSFIPGEPGDFLIEVFENGEIVDSALVSI